LAYGWIATIIIANLIDLAPGAIATLVSFLVPSYLFFVPVQKYINLATHKRDPAQPFARWSLGHILCLALGLAIWAFTILGFQIAPISLDSSS
jgi:hypothetical protein